MQALRKAQNMPEYGRVLNITGESPVLNMSEPRI